jgi:hypothetical protein
MKRNVFRLTIEQFRTIIPILTSGNSNKWPTWCNIFPVYYPDDYLHLNMFRAISHPSSGAHWLQWQPLVLPSYRGDSRAVFVVGPTGRSALCTVVQLLIGQVCDIKQGDGSDSLEIWRVAADILNSQSRTADKRRYSRLMVGRNANISLPLKFYTFRNNFTKSRNWTDLLVCH